MEMRSRSLLTVEKEGKGKGKGKLLQMRRFLSSRTLEFCFS